MLGFLRSILGIFTGGLSQIWHWVVSLFNSVWSYIYHMWDALVADISSAFHYALQLFNYLSSWVIHVVDNVVGLIRKVESDLVNFIRAWVGRIVSYVDSVYHWAIREINSLISWVDKIYNDIVHWIITQIWDPLYNFVRTALNWIEREGAAMWDILTHPNKLFSLIASYVWAQWLHILQVFAVPVTGFILSQLRGFIPELISLAEDVISKVL